MSGDSAYSFELRCLEPRHWHGILSGFEDVLVDQTAAYAAERWGSERLSHLVVREGGTPVAAAQVVSFRLPAVGSGLALVQHGPVYARRGRLPNAKALRFAIRTLVREFARKRGMLLRVAPKPVGERKALLAQACAEEGLDQLPVSPDQDRFLVDLRPPLDDIRLGMKPKWRHNLKRAEREGLEIVSSPVMEACYRFLDLHCSMRRRKQLEDRAAIEILPSLCSRLPSGWRPIILLCRHRGRDVAGAVLVTLGDTALYLFGASDDNALPLRAGFYLQWQAIRYLRRSPEVHWYDLGGDCGDPGLRQFKSGLIGSAGRVVPRPEFESPVSGLSSRLIRLALNTRQTMGQRGQQLARRTAAVWA